MARPRSSRRSTRSTRFRASRPSSAHRRPDASVKAQRIRHCCTGAEPCQGSPGILCARRTHSTEALGYLRQFGSLTVLNGHIHQNLAESGRERDLPYRPLDRLPAAGAGQRTLARANQRCACRKATKHTGCDERPLCGAQQYVGDRRRHARLTESRVRSGDDMCADWFSGSFPRRASY
jgi:hypothetical protein